MPAQVRIVYPHKLMLSVSVDGFESHPPDLNEEGEALSVRFDRVNEIFSLNEVLSKLDSKMRPAFTSQNFAWLLESDRDFRLALLHAMARAYLKAFQAMCSRGL